MLPLSLIFDWQSRFTAPRFLSLPVSPILLNFGLYATLGLWMYRMLVKNIKHSIEDIRLLSRWEALGFAVYCDFLFWAFWSPPTIAL